MPSHALPWSRQDHHSFCCLSPGHHSVVQHRALPLVGGRVGPLGLRWTCAYRPHPPQLSHTRLGTARGSWPAVTATFHGVAAPGCRCGPPQCLQGGCSWTVFDLSHKPRACALWQNQVLPLGQPRVSSAPHECHRVHPVRPIISMPFCHTLTTQTDSGSKRKQYCASHRVRAVVERQFRPPSLNPNLRSFGSQRPSKPMSRADPFQR